MNIMSINPALTLTARPDGAELLIMKKALDTFSQDGQNLISLLKQSATISPPHLGKKVDITA